MRVWLSSLVVYNLLVLVVGQDELTAAEEKIIIDLSQKGTYSRDSTQPPLEEEFYDPRNKDQLTGGNAWQVQHLVRVDTDIPFYSEPADCTLCKSTSYTHHWWRYFYGGYWYWGLFRGGIRATKCLNSPDDACPKATVPGSECTYSCRQRYSYAWVYLYHFGLPWCFPWNGSYDYPAYPQFWWCGRYVWVKFPSHCECAKV